MMVTEPMVNCRSSLNFSLEKSLLLGSAMVSLLQCLPPILLENGPPGIVLPTETASRDESWKSCTLRKSQACFLWRQKEDRKKKKDGKGVPSFVLNPDLDTCVYSSFLQNPAYELSSLIYFFLEQEIVLARRVPDQMKERV